MNNLYCQEDKKGTRRGYFDEVRSKKDSIIFKDTIKLYLDDTSYYLSKSPDELSYERKNEIGYFKYFTTIRIPEFELKEKLPDGFYCLYNLTRKEAKKVKDHEKYLIASGEYKEGLRQGAFIFTYIPERPSAIISKVIYFKNDTVHGIVKEMWDETVLHLAEYNMGVLDGFSYYGNGMAPVLLLYKDGILVRSKEFW